MRVLIHKDAFRYAALLLCVAAAGCQHQPRVPALAAQARTPDLFVPPPTVKELPPMISSLPFEVDEAKPTVAEEVKPKRKKRTSQATTAANTVPVPPPVGAPPVATPPEAQPEAATLGTLAPDGGANPKEHEEVGGKISAVEKRVNDLPAPLLEKEQKQIAKVRLFLKEASDALKGGDIEGAKILATKADLLVDDLQK